jgi:hypothetical protein
MKNKLQRGMVELHQPNEKRVMWNGNGAIVDH